MWKVWLLFVEVKAINLYVTTTSHQPLLRLFTVRSAMVETNKKMEVDDFTHRFVDNQTDRTHLRIASPWISPILKCLSANPSHGDPKTSRYHVFKRELKQLRRRRQRKRHSENWLHFLKTTSLWSQLFQFVKCGRTIQELNLKVSVQVQRHKAKFTVVCSRSP